MCTRFLIAFFTVFSFSCSQGTGAWTKYQAKGLREINEGFEKMLFIDSLNGFLFGDYYSDETFKQGQYEMASEAVIYKTTDAGVSWKRTTFGKGRFRDGFLLNGIIYAVKDSLAAVDIKNQHLKIYTSKDKGESWSPLLQNDALVQALVSNTSQRTAQLGDTLFIINLYRDSLVAFNIITSNFAPVKLPNDYKPQFIAIDNETLWLAGNHHNQIALLERKSTGESRLIPFPAVKKQGTLITAFHIAGNEISLITTDEATIIGATHRFFKSLNKGITWNTEELPDALYVQPVAFLGKNKVWTYCGTGFIQQRN